MLWKNVDHNAYGPVLQTVRPHYVDGWLHICYRPLTDTHVWARNRDDGGADVATTYDAAPIIARNKRYRDETIGQDQRFGENWVPIASIPSPLAHSRTDGVKDALENGDVAWLESKSKDPFLRGLSTNSKRITPSPGVVGARRPDGSKVQEAKR